MQYAMVSKLSDFSPTPGLPKASSSAARRIMGRMNHETVVCGAAREDEPAQGLSIFRAVSMAQARNPLVTASKKSRSA
jgi:hypothetical protein